MEMQLFAERRARFAERMEPGSVALFPASREKIRNHDVHYPFRQNSDFYYLTGLDEPESIAALIKEASGELRYILFVRPRDILDEIWTGVRAGVEGAREWLGATEAFELSEANKEIPALLEDRLAVYYALGFDDTFDRRVIGWLRSVRAAMRGGVNPPEQVRDPRAILHELRLRKTPAELELLRKACAISREAHREAMKAVQPGMNEFQIQALLDFIYRRNGSERNGYNHIVAGGKNACILHYDRNNQPLHDGDLLLIDSGAEYGHYSADITSTFPVNGRFSDKQKRIYEIVYGAQQAAIEACKPGNTFEQVQHAARDHLVAALIELGLLEGTVESIAQQEKELLETRRKERTRGPIKPEDLPYKQFYPHNIGHWLGMDVHDVGRYKLDPEHSQPLEPGMCLTIEPGLYFYEGYENCPKEWANIGIRIEDDILITESGHENLTAGTPHTVEEIEAIIQEPSSIPL